MNLAVNARDAMPTGGKLTFATTTVALKERDHHGVPPGSYVMMSITDTGCGMDKETQEHIFEPFFTTKEKGKGTGLGLSTVFGIVKQAKGGVSVESAPGKGATFKILLPCAEEAASKAVAPSVRTDLRGNETILLVEDEDALRHLTRRALEHLGYTIITAANGEEALAVAARHLQSIDLLFTDLTMPKMNGHQLALELRALRPGLPVLITSGFADPDRISREAWHVIDKPYRPEALAARVREALDAVAGQFVGAGS